MVAAISKKIDLGIENSIVTEKIKDARVMNDTVDFCSLVEVKVLCLFSSIVSFRISLQ